VSPPLNEFGDPISLPSMIAAPAYYLSPPCYGVKTRQVLLRTVGINAQEMGVVGSNKDYVPNLYAA
jgi:hypothetical protein